MILDCSACGTGNVIAATALERCAFCGNCGSHICVPVEPIEVHTGEDLDELLGAARVPVLVDFWTSFCPRCQLVAYELKMLAKERRGRLLVAKVFADALPRLVERYGVEKTPTMLLFRGGREGGRATGAMSADGILQRLGV